MLDEKTIKDISSKVISSLEDDMSNGNIENAFNSIKDLINEYLKHETREERVRILNIVVQQANEAKPATYVLPLLFSAQAKAKVNNVFRPSDPQLEHLLSISYSIWHAKNPEKLLKRLERLM